MEKYEYKVIYIADVVKARYFDPSIAEEHAWLAQLENALNIMGQDGWELILRTASNIGRASPGALIFKRKL